MSQIILASTSETILCVCYTNHALDDFLEGLLDGGIRDIVRVGGRSKNERVAEFNLREKAKDGKVPFTREQTRRYAQLKGTIEKAVKEVESTQRYLRREIGKGWWKTVGPHLQITHLEDWKQLRIETLTDKDGFKVVGVESEDHLWKQWIAGKKAGPPFQDRNVLPLWSLSKEERVLKKLEWQHELYEDYRVALDGSLKTIKNARDELKQLQDGTDSAILSQTRIIACTTTKAAMCKHLLDDVSAGVVLVEEAAEIFESHILTSLSKNTKRLIMIGDHKQLRPKAQHYPLTVESNRQYDLNRSLFERLAQVLPTSRLGIQHRMHPEISAIPRLTTYPELKDAPSTFDRPMIKGLQSRLIFIDHNHPEDSHETQIERVDAVSKTNKYEVDMVVAIVRYLFQQGYTPNKIVVLTPYLGQLLKIQQALSSTWSVLVDDMDFNEARNLLQGVEGFEQALGTNKGPVKSSVRIATIDNYQGEESDIVVASLVRGNPDHNIGFLREPERVNVLLSRARICEIVIGNRETLEGARGSYKPLRGGKLWKTILGYMDSTGNVFGGLPIVCQSHSKEAVLRTPEEIAEYSPDGGCSQPCTRILECGHPCTKLCHVGPCTRCSVLCRDTCPRGHAVNRICSEIDTPKCQHTISWKCPLGHALSGLCFRGKDSSGCTSCQILQEKEEKQRIVEQKLQAALDQKHHELEASRDQLQEALRESLHRQQLSMVDEEMALVERQLLEAQERNVLIPSSQSNTVHDSLAPSNKSDEGKSFLEDLGDIVRNLLCQSESKTLPATEIATFYRTHHGRDLQRDANRFIGNADGSQMPYQAIFERVPCCEIVSLTNAGGKRRKKGMVLQLANKEPADDSKPSSDKVGAHVRSKTAREDDLCTEITTKKARIDDLGLLELSKAKQTAVLPDVPMEDVSGKDDETSISGADKRHSTGDPARSDTVVGAMDSGAASHEPESHHNIRSTVREDDKFDTFAAVSDVVQRFKDEGPLAADNLLDEIKNEPSFMPSSEIQSLDYIIAESLDPAGNIARRPPSKPDMISGLCELVCFYSFSMYCSAHEFPLQAQQFARKALAIVEEEDLQFPDEWLSRAKFISQAAPEDVNAKQYNMKEDTPDDKWSLVLTGDHKAPPIMKDSVLPMIGLKFVKNSMIGMYHRTKLAQEQNDGAAASYNIRFEGNPGTG